MCQWCDTDQGDTQLCSRCARGRPYSTVRVADQSAPKESTGDVEQLRGEGYVRGRRCYVGACETRKGRKSRSKMRRMFRKQRRVSREAGQSGILQRRCARPR
eukprot:6155210-Pleurochrysis_carterae.AAC.2